MNEMNGYNIKKTIMTRDAERIKQCIYFTFTDFDLTIRQNPILNKFCMFKNISDMVLFSLFLLYLNFLLEINETSQIFAFISDQSF